MNLDLALHKLPRDSKKRATSEFAIFCDDVRCFIAGYGWEKHLAEHINLRHLIVCRQA